MLVLVILEGVPPYRLRRQGLGLSELLMLDLLDLIIYSQMVVVSITSPKGFRKVPGLFRNLWKVAQQDRLARLSYLIQVIFNFDPRTHMKLVMKEQHIPDLEKVESGFPKQSSGQQDSSSVPPANPHLAFEKNYPKNIFIPLIEHLSQLGLQKHYQECVGTRQSFEGKNVVSLAQIHKVLSQNWFQEKINLGALVSNVSNKILMNSKIKKKLFHLLLLRDLFTVPRHDPRQFKKLVSKLANDVAHSKLPNDPLFSHPSALIYLLSLFTDGLTGRQMGESGAVLGEVGVPDDKRKSCFNNQEMPLMEVRGRSKDISSKEEYKYYISKIITTLNSFQQEPAQLLDLLEGIKSYIAQREKQVRDKYKLQSHVPEWMHFGLIVINNAYLYKRNRQKITFSLLNQWIQEFKEKSTSIRGYGQIAIVQDSKFRPIVLVSPPA